MNIEKIKAALQSILVEFGAAKLANGEELQYEGETLEVGVKIEAEDGEYELEDGTILVVKEGLVDSLTPKADGETVEEVEEEVEAEEEEEVAVEEPEVVEETEPTEEEKDYEAMIVALEERVAKLEEQIVEILSTPAVEPVAEEFKKATAPTDKKYDYLKNINWKH